MVFTLMMKMIEDLIQKVMTMTKLKSREISKPRTCFTRILEFRVKMLWICQKANLMTKMAREQREKATATLDRSSPILNLWIKMLKTLEVSQILKRLFLLHLTRKYYNNIETLWIQISIIRAIENFDQLRGRTNKRMEDLPKILNCYWQNNSLKEVE